MDYAVLQTEIQTDPLARGYAAMSDAEVAADMNTAYRSRNKTSISGSKVFQAIILSEFDALTAAEQQRVWDVLHLGMLDPFGREADVFVSIFGGGSATIAALQAARVEAITRAEELGLPRIKAGYVQKVRA